MRKQSVNSIMSENLFDDLEQMTFVKANKKSGKEEKHELNIESKKSCIQKSLIK